MRVFLFSVLLIPQMLFSQKNKSSEKPYDIFSSGNFHFKIFSETSDLGKEASADFAREIRSNSEKNLKTVFILPTGSTPLSMYHWLVLRWKKGFLDLSDVIIFNLDEYVGLAKDHHQSYNYYMHNHFLGFVSNRLSIQKFKEFGLFPVREEIYQHYKNIQFTTLDSLNKVIISFINSLIVYFNSQSISNDFASVKTQIQKIISLKEEYQHLVKIYFNDTLFPSVDSLTNKIIEARRLMKYGFPLENHFIPSGDEKNIQKNILQFRNELQKYILSPEHKVVLFAGIGKGPAHIAFNDFVEEDFVLDFNKNEFEKTLIARKTKTRKVKLTLDTRNANSRFFDKGILDVPKEAVTIGFDEILKVDRIIVLATGLSKINSLYQTTKINKPSYKVPASLLRFFDKTVEFYVDKKAYGIYDKNFDSLYKLHYTSKQQQKINNQKKNKKHKTIMDIKENSAINFIINYEALDGRSHYLNQYQFPSGVKVLLVKDRIFPVMLESELIKLNNNVLKESRKSFNINKISDFSLIVIPFDLFEKIKRFKSFLLKGKTIIAYQGEKSLFEIHEKLSKTEIKKKAKALEKFHLSQVYRTPFGEIIREMSNYNKLFNDLNQSTECYSYVDLKSHNLFHKNKAQLSQDIHDGDVIFVIAPHPDDAEIGTGGLLQKLASKKVSTYVLNATSGFKALIKKSIFSDEQFYSRDLMQLISQERGTYILNNSLKEKIRLEESATALKFLNPSIDVHFVDLPFYKHGQKNFTPQDIFQAKQFLESFLDKINSKQKYFFFLPHIIDMHKTHRITSKVFEKALLELMKEKVEFKPKVLYYQTPWTGNWNFYHYHKTLGSKFIALVGLEFLVGNGEESITYNESLFPFANRYFIETF